MREIILDNSYKAKFAAKWSEPVANRGFVPVPKCLITCMGDLGLKPNEAAILFNIMEKCWKAGDVSWQKVDTMASNIGRKNSATRAITKSLADKGFITKTQQYDSSNIYGLEPLIKKLDAHMKECRYAARKPEEGSRNSDSRASRKTSDYVEPDLIRTSNVEPMYSQFVKSNKTDKRFYDFNNKVTNDYSKHPCMTTKGLKHEWGEPFDIDKGENKFGEEVVWRYRECKRCQDKFHKKVNRSDYAREAGELVKISKRAIDD